MDEEIGAEVAWRLVLSPGDEGSPRVRLTDKDCGSPHLSSATRWDGQPIGCVLLLGLGFRFCGRFVLDLGRDHLVIDGYLIAGFRGAFGALVGGEGPGF